MRATVLALMSFLVSCSPAWAQPDTEILWDTWGVPHIYASTQQQAFRAFGYAQMHAHADLLLRMYAAGRGRAAEVYGAPFVELDQYTRTLGGPERGRRRGTRCSRLRSRQISTRLSTESTNTRRSIQTA